MTEETKQKATKALGWTVKVAALCIIMFQYAASFSTPALSAIAEAFGPAGIDRVMVQQIVSIPSLMAIVGAASVGIMERFMKKKTMLWIAMICTLVGGVVSGFMPETELGFWGILACRVVMGFGRGMIFPMASSYIADLFMGKTRDRLMSFKTAVGGVSGAVFQLIGGFLAVLSWQYAFIGTLFIIPIILMIAFWLPEPEVKTATEAVKSGKKVMTPAVWVLIIFAFVLNFFQFSMFTNFSLIIAAANLGSTALAGSFGSTITLATAAGAIIYGAFLKGKLGGFDIGIALIGEAIGFFILCFFVSVEAYFAGAIIFGFAFGILNPALILQCVKLVPKEGATRSLSILAALQNFGQYLSSYILTFVASALGLVGAAGTFAGQIKPWLIAWPSILVLAIGSIVVFAILKKRNPDLVAGLPVKAQPELSSDSKSDQDSESK